MLSQPTDGSWADYYCSLLRECLKMEAVPEAKQVHAHTIQTGFISGVSIATFLLTIYSKWGCLEDARQLFDGMPERNLVSWTAMIAGYVRRGMNEEAWMLFSTMQLTGIQPNEFIFATVLPVCANLVSLQRGKVIHQSVIRGGLESDVYVGSALVDMYVKCGSIEDAQHVFDKMPTRNLVSWNAIVAGCAQNGYVDEALRLFWEMPERNVVSWSAMIAGYAKNGQFDKALEMFRQMQLTGVKANVITFASVLPACASLAALKQGKEAHEGIIRCKIEENDFVETALVDMYAKCGSIEDASKVFDKMSKQNVVSWNAMIVGYAMHGCAEDALQLFERMVISGIKPDHVSFIGVLSACCHAGLVDDGWQYFLSMDQHYQIKPTVEHYCCMVDLLGRTGRLHEAQDLIDKMLVKPDAAVWTTLLGACRVHTNVDLGKHVAELLRESDPTNSAHYVLLSNIYAAAGRWADKEKVRKSMKHSRIKRMPGCSWIEVNNNVYTFQVGDNSHPQTKNI